MFHPRSREKGFSLIELIVVLVIVGILALTSLSMIGDRPGSAVRSVMDELEGVLTAARTNAQVTRADVTLFTDGTWTGAPLFLSYQSDDVDPTKPKNNGLTPEAFRSHFVDRQRDHIHAGIDSGNGWYATAIGGFPGIDSVPPITTEASFMAAMGKPLFSGGADRSILVNGNSKRFTQGFFITIVGLRNGATYVGAPIGVLVVPTNGTGVYKFYKGANSATWRRV